uniref:Uncharacterized protein n=1 Tax=Rhizophora mucronata TaxID=61149 RepID=A0A2P2N8T1_RHIMU
MCFSVCSSLIVIRELVVLLGKPC